MTHQESDPNLQVDSPCIKVCELDHSEVCKGCKRTLEEIAMWIYMSPLEKKQVVLNCKVRKSQAAEL